MPKKLTPEQQIERRNQVNISLEQRGITMIGPYINIMTGADFECHCGHIWEAAPNNVTRGSGCPICSSNRLTKEIVDQRLSTRNIIMVGEYKGVHSKSDFQCEYGHIWQSNVANVVRKTGCPHCAGQFPLSTEIINSRITDRGITIIGDYITTHSKTKFRCSFGHEWEATPNSILYGNCGCPYCAEYGFNPKKPAWIYILIFENFIKYGITNNLDQRLIQHKRNGNYTISLTKLYNDGSIAQNWEKNIKIIFGGRYVTKEIMPDGHTETLSPDKLNLLLETVG